MKKYEKYKDSGVKWLGEIPEHWEVLPCKRYFFYKKEINKNNISNNVLSLTLRGVVNNDIENPEGLVPKDYATYQLFEKGNLVFKLIDLENISTSRVGIVHEDGIMSSAYIRLISGPKNFNKYAFYFYFSLYKNQIFNKLGSGVRSTLNPTDLLNLSFVNPPLSEQTAIANFLDDKTAKIDQAIAIKEKEINLLKERRQILIQKAVTKGLDPNVKLKHSGVDWIGEIPEHWEVRKLKYVLTMRNEKIESKTTEKIYVGMENIESQTGKYFSTDSQVEGLANIFYKNDILFGKLRPYLAKVYLSEFDGICSTEFLVYKSDNSSYYQRVLLSDIFIKLVDSSTYGAKMPRASADFINNISIPAPPEKEQAQIVSYLEEIEEKIAKAISLKQQEIEKLKEYKTVLIDNVVTGKVML